MNTIAINMYKYIYILNNPSSCSPKTWSPTFPGTSKWQRDVRSVACRSHLDCTIIAEII